MQIRGKTIHIWTNTLDGIKPTTITIVEQTGKQVERWNITSNLSSEIHDHKQQRFDEDQLVVKNPLESHVLVEKLYSNTPTTSAQCYHKQ